MRRKGLILLVFAVAVVTGPAVAQEIVHFTNGTSMPVRSHEIEGDMIYVVLDSAASLAFPLEQVERIEDAEGQLFQLHQSPTNKMVSKPLTRAAQTSATVPPRLRRGQWETDHAARGPAVETDSHGVAFTRPAGNAYPNRRRLKNTGDRSILSQQPAMSSKEGVIGTTRYGKNFVLPGKGREQQQTPIGLTSGGGSAAPKPKKK